MACSIRRETPHTDVQMEDMPSVGLEEDPMEKTLEKLEQPVFHSPWAVAHTKAVVQVLCVPAFPQRAQNRDSEQE